MAYRLSSSEQNFMVRENGDVECFGTDFGAPLVFHDLYETREGRRMVVKCPAHKRFGGRGCPQINEPGRYLDFLVTKTKTLPDGETVVHARLMAETYIRPQVAPALLAKKINET